MLLPSTSTVRASARTILLKVSPAPSSLSERRAILHLLKKYSDVEFFKRLHDPSHFISIVGNPQIAHRLVEQSPLEFDYIPPKQERRTAILPSPPVKPILANTTTTTTTPQNAQPPARTFLVKIVEKPDYPHRTRIRESLLYGRWPAHHADGLFQQDSAAKAALRRACADRIDTEGLADWESFGQADEDEGLASLLTSKRDFVQARRIRQGNSGSGFMSLVEMWNGKHGEREGRIGEGGVGGQSAAGGGGEGQGGAGARDKVDDADLD